MQSFETERLIIRPTQIEDAALVLEFFNSPKSLKYIGDRSLHSEEDALRYIQDKMLPQLNELGFSSYTIIRKEDHEKLGVCGLYNRPSLEGIDIGFGLLPRYEDKGYAYESAFEVMRIAFEIFHLPYLRAVTLKENSASRMLLEKLSMTLENETKEENGGILLVYYKQNPNAIQS